MTLVTKVSMDERRNSEKVILRWECEEINNYASQFPPEEREQRMMEWINRYATAYRANMEDILSFVNRTLEEREPKNETR